MLNEKSLHSVLGKTTEWGEFVKSFETLDSRQATEPNLAASITGQRSFYLPGG